MSGCDHCRLSNGGKKIFEDKAKHQLLVGTAVHQAKDGEQCEVLHDAENSSNSKTKKQKVKSDFVTFLMMDVHLHLQGNWWFVPAAGNKCK